MPNLLVVSDAPWVREEVKAAIVDPDTTVRELTAGVQVLAAVQDRTPDLVVLDEQVGNMGAIATTLDLRLEEGAGRLPHVPILILLDRRADVFLAKRADADGWVVKPVDAIRLRRAMTELLAGRTFHDDAFKPPTISTP